MTRKRRRLYAVLGGMAALGLSTHEGEPASFEAAGNRAGVCRGAVHLEDLPDGPRRILECPRRHESLVTSESRTAPASQWAPVWSGKERSGVAAPLSLILGQPTSACPGLQRGAGEARAV